MGLALNHYALVAIWPGSKGKTLLEGLATDHNGIDACDELVVAVGFATARRQPVEIAVRPRNEAVDAGADKDRYRHRSLRERVLKEVGLCRRRRSLDCSAQRCPRKQACGIERGQRRIRIVHDQGNLGAAEYDGVATLIFHPSDNPLKVSDRLGLETAVNQLM